MLLLTQTTWSVQVAFSASPKIGGAQQVTFGLEGLTMPYTMEDFRRDVALEHVHKSI